MNHDWPSTLFYRDYPHWQICGGVRGCAYNQGAKNVQSSKSEYSSGSIMSVRPRATLLSRAGRAGGWLIGSSRRRAIIVRQQQQRAFPTTAVLLEEAHRSSALSNTIAVLSVRTFTNGRPEEASQGEGERETPSVCINSELISSSCIIFDAGKWSRKCAGKTPGRRL